MKVYTITECAMFMRVAPRTVAKWFDSGRLKGYKLPGSNDRRVPEEYLIRFMESHGLPLPDQLRCPDPIDVIAETIRFYQGLGESDMNTAAIAALQSVLQRLNRDTVSKEMTNEN